MDFCPSLNKHKLNLLLNQTSFLNIAPVLITSPSSLHSSLTPYFLSYQTNYLSSLSRSFSTYPPLINPHSLNILTLKMSPLLSNHLMMPASLFYLLNFLESIFFCSTCCLTRTVSKFFCFKISFQSIFFLWSIYPLHIQHKKQTKKN